MSVCDPERFTNNVWRELIEPVSVWEPDKDIKYLTSLVFKRPDGIPTIVISLFADYHKGQVKLCPDLVDHAWVTLEEAENYDLIDGIYEELEMLNKILNGQKVNEWKKRN